ncbi:hypothetical protein JTE90_007305 [Oedothorax gibbosus]|uniref:Uncharacterized protein n=1 Tax=Oedothorax gibbosus TaxID=931172 RepID=A0AAV6UFM7_9ARAC|nr:hypothetical protein JTE90_007305 [Oedothorax gibbosus]
MSSSRCNGEVLISFIGHSLKCKEQCLGYAKRDITAGHTLPAGPRLASPARHGKIKEWFFYNRRMGFVCRRRGGE